MEGNLIKSLPNNKILDWTELKAFADYKLDVAKIMISVSDRVENIVQCYETFCVFRQYQRYFSYLTATVKKSMYPGPYLTST